MLKARNVKLFVAVILLSGAAGAQTPPTVVQDNGTAAPPPPVATPGVPPAFNTMPVDPNMQGGLPAVPPPIPPAYNEDSYFMPVQPESGGFDTFYDEDEPYGGDAGGGEASGGGEREGKESFKLVRRPATADCKVWGSSLLTPTYSDRGSCQDALDRKVDGGFASIEQMYDQVEFYKLKQVIRGRLKDRNEAAKYPVSFDSLKNTLRDASRKGCSCKDR